jgi:hypothetical protein
VKVSLHHRPVDPVDAWRSRTTGCQRDARRFGQPSSVGNQSQESIELAFFVVRRPRRQLALHFTDYQRSSPHCSRVIRQASHSNCPPSPCGRLSRPRTTTRAPSTCTVSGNALPYQLYKPSPVHTLDSTHGRGCLSQSFSLRSASRRERRGLATRSPWLPAGRLTYPPAFAGQSIRVTGTDPRPAHKAVWAGVTFQPSDAFQ